MPAICKATNNTKGDKSMPPGCGNALRMGANHGSTKRDNSIMLPLLG
jgi:hypothetical protein